MELQAAPRRPVAVRAGVALCIAFCLAACVNETGGPDAVPLSDNGWTPERPAYPGNWPAQRWPSDNPYSPAKAILGRRLFFETRLSSDKTISCGWCHDPYVAFTFKHGGLGSGVRQRLILRGPPTLLNVGLLATLMGDGSESALEEQALRPLFASNEMDMSEETVLSALAGDTLYARLFRQAYGSDHVTLQRIVRALATYERTLASYRSAYDRWAAGDSAALTPEERRGAALFTGKARCSQCHVPPLFTDEGFHDVGLEAVPADVGRGAFTGIAADSGRFKTPTLRNVSVTAPFMHDGRLASLEDVVEHYDAGPVPGSRADARLHPLGLTFQEKADLIAFLRALEDPYALALTPP